MSYAVVCFLEEGDGDQELVQEVPLSWLRNDNQICLWPQSNSKFHILNRTVPNSLWKACPIRCEKICETLAEARRRCINETSSEEERGRGQRKKTLSKHLAGYKSKCESPPLPDIPPASQDKEYRVIAIQPPDIGNNFEDYDEETQVTCHQVNSSQSSNISWVLEENVEKNVENQILKDDRLSKIEGKLDKIMDMMANITIDINSLVNNKKPHCETHKFEMRKYFPLNTVDALEELDKNLETDEELKKNLTKYFTTVGGLSAKDFHTRAMTKIMTNDLAMSCSWKGLKNNHKVGDMVLLQCLYGDVAGSRTYPVMVFIHGESFEWNSGNPYDGSVLAAYGKVIVITINFRLGILGFLKAGTELESKSNFGLVDQIAALLWVKDNIAAFGGDINSVTLFGHGTGAVCASLLMISPMILKGNERLFHRAILMGGTALADWALAGNPTGVTYQVSKALNCQIHDDFAECLRRKRLDEIMAAGAITPDYKTRFGPVVDSIVVPNEPKKSMTQYNDLFRRFELMYGVTEQESLHLLGPVELSQGMLEKERDQELLAYFHSRCEMKPNLCLQRTLDEYSRNEDSQSDQLYEDYTGYEPDRASLARDAVLDILSDARSVAPIVQMARYHAALNLQSYFYVFTHKTHSKEYIRDKSYNGEELPYVFGVPLDGPKFHFVDTYTEPERMFSEIVMMYFSNFAETGNPNMPKREMFYSMNPAYWAQFDVEWPEFDLKEQRYIELKIPPQPSKHYRGTKMRYWNQIFPNLTENIPFNSYPQSHPTKKTSLIYLAPKPPRRTPPSFLYDHLTKRTTTTPMNRFENFFKPFKPTTNEVFGTIVDSGESRPDNMIENVYGTVKEAPAPPAEVRGSSTLNILTIVGGLFLIVNLILLVVLYFKCYRNKKENRGKPTISQVTSEDEKRQKDGETFLIDGCNFVRMMSKSSKSEETYEAVKAGATPKHKLSRQMSSSTIDAHTKVREWIAQEIIQKYSPRFFRRQGQENNPKKGIPRSDEFNVSVGGDKDSTIGRSPTRPVSPVEQKTIAMKTSTVTRHKVKVPKISVAVDATPSGRGPSVLMQQPAELTKSLDYSAMKPDVEVPLRRSFTLEDFSPRIIDNRKDLRKSSTSIHINPTDLQPTVIKISHAHSRSDPVQDVDYTAMKRLKTFDPNQNVNVTCRDENDSPIPLTPEESLRTIKRRNFPKVLPDHPGREIIRNKRLSMPTHGYMPVGDCSSFSPPNSSLGKGFDKYPPAPPPRASTLTKQSSNPLPVFISEPTLAEEPEEEPEVVCNNLYVGPLIPKRKPGNVPVYGSLGNIKCSNASKTMVGSNTEIKKSDSRLGIKPPLATKPVDQRWNKMISRTQQDDCQKREGSNRNLEEIDSEKLSLEDNQLQCTKGIKLLKKSQIPMPSKATNSNKSSSSESTPSEESDTGTVVKKI